jgi:small subunit ribosomal protein S17
VKVDRRFMHPMYKKYITKSKRYAAHDEKNTYVEGDLVNIEECRPISKTKTWVVLSQADKA